MIAAVAGLPGEFNVDPRTNLGSTIVLTIYYHNHFMHILTIYYHNPIIYVLTIYSRSTIHGRIDQVKQVLELHRETMGAARYGAVDKWCAQIASLNDAIINRMS